MDTTFKTIWLSDVHLGSRACRVQLLLDFLRHARCDTLYLVGDIIDLESLRQQLLLADEPHGGAARAVEEEPGRHAHRLYPRQSRRRHARADRDCGSATSKCSAAAFTRPLRPVAACSCCTATSSTRVDQARLLARRSSARSSYRGLLGLNRFVHWLHDVSGRPYWSLAQHVKTKVGAAPSATSRRSGARRCKLPKPQASTASCAGTFTRPRSIEHDNGIVYCNDGDWVESCTALTERPDGRLELLTWRPQAALAALGQPLRDAA